MVRAEMTAVLEIEDLTRSFGGREIVRSLDLEVQPGERVALRGANGSGKTTVLRCIAGTVFPTGGQIRIGGHPAGSLGARRIMGVSLSQERSFYLRLTGHVNLLFYARLRHDTEQAARANVEALEEELELGEIAAKTLNDCSTGMVQQIGLARALIGDPSVVLLDEPTRSLDTDAADRLWNALERRAGTAVLIATHRHEDLSHCDRHVELHG
ncbi:MAG: type transport system ATP-binding protein [Thermoleophilaceae bacterium]|jgi:ABC-type multidrug transport system ATPase subunit|nr:type transport system ATP-binding protein [Thermoleophilaceae bacterium]